MEILAIDAGGYSLKFLRGTADRKKLTIHSIDEVVIADVLNQFESDAGLLHIHMEVIKTYIEEHQFEGKIITQYPNYQLTTRFLNLPTTNMRKAELMIPFQLEENLPFGSSDIHYSSKLFKQKDSIFSLSSITDTESFKFYYKSLEKKGILPNIITCEISLFQDFIQNNNSGDSYCILDLGHETTKAYFVKDSQIVSTHISYVGGNVINEVLSETYQIEREDAVIYKHENSFLLTQSQYEDVDEDQKDFALLMKKIFTPLINDLRRWELGFRMNNGSDVDKILLCGGTSNVKNITNFFTQTLSIKTEYLDSFDIDTQENLDLTASEDRSYCLVNLMGKSLSGKGLPINFKVREYASTQHGSIPLHSAVFIGMRVVLVSLVLLTSFMIERSSIKTDLDILNREITRIAKKELKYTSKQIRRVKNDSSYFEKTNQNHE